MEITPGILDLGARWKKIVGFTLWPPECNTEFQPTAGRGVSCRHERTEIPKEGEVRVAVPWVGTLYSDRWMLTSKQQMWPS